MPAAKESAELYPELPDDIPKAVWEKWPRKSEAHALFSVRQRAVKVKLASGALKCYGCPDDTVRIPIDQLRAVFAEPGSVPASDRGVDRIRASMAGKVRMTDADLSLDDPVVGMFRECRIMLREEREHSRAQLESRDQTNQEQLKLLTGPVQAATKMLQELCERLSTRVAELEARQDAVTAEREMMADFRQARDVELEQVRAREKRRTEVVELLKRELGPVLISKIGGTADSLSAFVANVRPELVELLLESKLLSPEQEKRLRAIMQSLQPKAAAAPPAPAGTPPVNGAASAQTEEQSS
jgi:hypothetical protein